MGTVRLVIRILSVCLYPDGNLSIDVNYGGSSGFGRAYMLVAICG